MSFQCRAVLNLINVLEESNNYFKGVYAHTKKMILCTKAKGPLSKREGKINMTMIHYQANA